MTAKNFTFRDSFTFSNAINNISKWKGSLQIRNEVVRLRWLPTCITAKFDEFWRRSACEFNCAMSIKICNYRPITHFDGYGHNYCETLIGICMWSITTCSLWPWVTFEGHFSCQSDMLWTCNMHILFTDFSLQGLWDTKLRIQTSSRK